MRILEDWAFYCPKGHVANLFLIDKGDYDKSHLLVCSDPSCGEEEKLYGVDG